MITLPTEKVKAKVSNPRFLILFGRPKAGKTSCVAALDNNLIVDLEGGSEFLECLSIQARTVNDLAEIANALGYKVLRIDLFRTRLATATKEKINEEVVILEYQK